jgi:hypothetical protein
MKKTPSPKTKKELGLSSLGPHPGALPKREGKKKKPIKKKFKGQLLSGHKDYAVEVPFDPSMEWKVEPQPLWHGRRGFPVRGKIGRVSFESAIVPRQKKYYLLIDRDVQPLTGVSEESQAVITIEPI